VVPPPVRAAHYGDWRAGGAGRWRPLPAICPEKGPHMRRKPLLRFVLAAVLALGLLPAAAVAKAPVHATASRPGWRSLPGNLWDLLLLQLFGPAPHLKNRSQIDPDGSAVAPAPPQSDNGIQIDPNG
jgi:hypothetical protein